MSIPQVSEEKALAIVKAYPSIKCNEIFLIKELISAYLACDMNQREKMLENIPVFFHYDKTKSKRLGKAISSKIYKIFTYSDGKTLVND